MRLPWVHGDGPIRTYRYGASIDMDFASVALDMKQQVSFAMRLRHHCAIHGVKADAPECAVEHGHSLTHRPPIGIR